ncbi:hypothetical protein C723_1452 [Christiangramia flava JLT2011]|uniref:Uncharacterized protein n=1 Tax=Christiangramia flava JLT2011 TaxID=1229726 RepID=A0A1L7IAD0_9FLAO|nr:hypothetical protein GRFL_3341 [Christiangramia flava JLT2011]OSS39550.1 hypothetical protein C723_1452 [Christiangramia flava JLT2011]
MNVAMFFADANVTFTYKPSKPFFLFSESISLNHLLAVF